jgi:hypothetical protein
LIGESWIGGAIFSAGAGGNAGVAPSLCAVGSGRAGCGAIPDGLLSVPVVVGSAGADGLVSAPGVDRNGAVACAICMSAFAGRACDIPDTARVEAIVTPTNNRLFL